MSIAPSTTRAPDRFTREAPDLHPGLSSTNSRLRAVITGAGLLTPLGRSVAEIWDALLAARFITDHSRAAGEFDRTSPRVIQMARRVADQALADAGWSKQDDFATIVGTSKGSVESWLGNATPLQHISNITYEAGGLNPAGLGDIAASLAAGYGPRLTVSAACASGLLALIRGAMMIESGQASRVLVVAAEASVHPLFLASFKRLGVLPAPEIGCRPFDRSRDGFLMSECAAAVCLQASMTGGGEESLASAGDAMVAIERYAIGGDGTHLTAADPAGRVLGHLIHKVTQSGHVDLIHAHGTGTLTNDPIELAALESVFQTPTSAPCLYSHKGALGHSLGAAGLVSVVLNHQAHRHGIIPPNIRTTDPLPTAGVQIHSTTQERPIHRSLTLAAGFGGATAAITLVSL
jgi:3-oxoacyl-[acyl-carrier-protein] synthase II